MHLFLNKKCEYYSKKLKTNIVFSNIYKKKQNLK